MAVTTTQQITRYYDLYRNSEIIFTKEILKVLHIDPRQIYIKCGGSQWSCIINSSSLMSARIIVGTKGGAYAAIQKTNTPVSLRFSFADYLGKSMSLFVNTRVATIESYMNSTELAIATLAFNSKPPDDLIEVIGRLLETNANFLHRTEERIPITVDSKRRLSLIKEETMVFVQNIPRNCIVRDISFSGAKILMMGLSQFLQKKETILRLEFDEPREIIDLKGFATQVESIQGRKDLVALSMEFDKSMIPISYKLHINNCLTAVRQKMLSAVENTVIPQQPENVSEEATKQEQQEKIETQTEEVPKTTEDTAVQAQTTENKADATKQQNQPTDNENAQGTQ